MPVADLSSIDVNSLFFGPPRREKNGQLIVPVGTDASNFTFGTRLRFQMGRDQEHMLISTYGFNSLMDGQPKDTPRRNMDLTPTAEVEEALNRIDEWVGQNAATRSQEFFKSPTLNKQHVPMVRTHSSGSKIVRVKVPVGDNPAEISRILPNKLVVPADWSTVGRNVKVVVIVDTPGIWHNPTQFGVSLTARQLLIEETAPANGLQAFNLLPGLVEAPDGDADMGECP